MPECPKFDYLLVVPRLRVQNANAISSPLTHGFPAMTAFIGLMWALQRKTAAQGLGIRFHAVSVVVHDHEEQVSDEGYVKTFRLTRNPVEKDGKTAAIVEEGRTHLTISLVFAVTGDAFRDPEQADILAQKVSKLLGQMRVAGGSVVPSALPAWRTRAFVVSQTGDAEGRSSLFKRLKMRLLPGFLLVERQDLLETRYQALQRSNNEATRLDAWLSLARFNWHWQPEEGSGGKGSWQHDRKGQGWLVPIPVGYAALTELQAPGAVANARDPARPFRFVESLYGIGQWLSPHRLDNPQQMLWFAESDAKNGQYRCRNAYQPLQYDDPEADFS